MSSSNANLDALKKQYEAALVNEAHSQWTIDTASFTTRIFNYDSLLQEEALREGHREQARKIAVEIHRIDPDKGMFITNDIERDVDQYMEKRKADYNRKK